MKKIFIILLVTIFISLEGTSTKAIDPEPVPYWYSDQDLISRFTASTVYYDTSIENGCGMDPTDIALYFQYADNVWDNVFAITFMQDSNADIDITCISRAEANILNLPITWAGAGGTTNATYNRTYWKPDMVGRVKFYSHTESQAFLIWDTTGSSGALKTDLFSVSTWAHVAAHEFGHTMGFKGHNTQGSLTLMYPYINTVMLPDYYDIEQMKLVYTLQ